MIRVLFVCHGNICRSPMAEMIAAHLIRERGLEGKVCVYSCATSTEELGNPIYPNSKEELIKHGIPLIGHFSNQLTTAMYDEYDYILGMDAFNMRNMLRIVGQDSENKLHLLRDYCEDKHDVSDPWYTRRFDVAYNDIYEGCVCFLDYLSTQL